MKTNSNPNYNEARQKCRFIVLTRKKKKNSFRIKITFFFLFCLDENNTKIMVWGQRQDKSEILLHSDECFPHVRYENPKMYRRHPI